MGWALDAFRLLGGRKSTWCLVALVLCYVALGLKWIEPSNWDFALAFLTSAMIGGNLGQHALDVIPRRQQGSQK